MKNKNQKRELELFSVKASEVLERFGPCAFIKDKHGLVYLICYSGKIEDFPNLKKEIENGKTIFPELKKNQ